ncbi:uncharacterized protein LOC106693673 [Microplitis demolitor]|uniref:uncharacterized protein LOC106693673 n=1 Tax=Microplitis demolitor TaxID=69319 RepID=UPI0006D4EB96|nr:uncharacterized protein LOC106693673 [Microplitis demolitor]
MSQDQDYMDNTDVFENPHEVQTEGNPLNTINTNKLHPFDISLKKRVRDENLSDQDSDTSTSTSKKANITATPPNYSDLIKNKYNQDNKGSYELIIEHDKTSHLSPPTHYLSLCKLITDTLKKNNAIQYLKNMKQIGKKAAIILNSRTTANLLVNHKDFKEHGLIAYIPVHRMVCYGIIKDVPVDFPMEDLKEGTQSIVEIMAFERCQRAVMENNARRYVPSKTIKVTFAGQIRPNHVSIYNAIHKVYVYVAPVKRCTNCLRFNHPSKECSHPSRCRHCGENKNNHPEDNSCPYINLPPKCANCKGAHESMSSNRPALDYLKSLYNCVAINNISYAETKNRLKSNNNYSANSLNYADS